MDFPDTENRYSRTEFAQLLNVSKKTLERWEKSKRLVPEQYVVNDRPYYTNRHLIDLGSIR
jgi:DNA-binding transcriptional MerR regulator